MDLSLVAGTGPGGRIIKADVEDFLKAPRPAAGAPGAAPAAPGVKAPLAPAIPPSELRKVRQLCPPLPSRSRHSRFTAPLCQRSYTPAFFSQDRALGLPRFTFTAAPSTAGFECGMPLGTPTSGCA